MEKKDKAKNFFRKVKKAGRERLNSDGIIDLIYEYNFSADDLNTMKDENGRTLLHILAERSDGSFEAVVNEISDLDINVRDKNGNTPLHSAMDKSNEKVADFLIKKGAEKFVLNNQGLTAFEKSGAEKIKSEYLKLLQELVLLQKGIKHSLEQRLKIKEDITKKERDEDKQIANILFDNEGHTKVAREENETRAKTEESFGKNKKYNDKLNKIKQEYKNNLKKRIDLAEKVYTGEKLEDEKNKIEKEEEDKKNKKIFELNCKYLDRRGKQFYKKSRDEIKILENERKELDSKRAALSKKINKDIERISNLSEILKLTNEEIKFLDNNKGAASFYNNGK